LLHQYVQKFYKEDTGKVNYQEMAKDLQGFNFDAETNFGVLPKSAHSISSGAGSIQGVATPKDCFNDEYVVLDTKRAPQHSVDGIEKRMVKMNRLIKDKFTSQEAFARKLKERAGCDDNGNLNCDDFKTFIVETCREDLIARNVCKQDIESFLSAFTFNNHGATDITKVAPLVWEDNQQKLATVLTTRVRANPPPVLANEELGTTVKAIPDCDNDTQKRLRGLLVQIENKVFDSKPRFYQVFKQMDTDNDGFISYKDFEQHLEKNKIFASKEEIVTLMTNVLDTEQKGYIDFQTFQKRIKPRMSDQVKVEENELYANNLVPNVEKLNEYGEKSATLRNSITQINKVFRPDPDTIKLVQATRFGAKPEHQNTFGHYTHGPKEPGFVSAAERATNRGDLTMQHKVAF